MMHLLAVRPLLHKILPIAVLLTLNVAYAAQTLPSNDASAPASVTPAASSETSYSGTLKGMWNSARDTLDTTWQSQQTELYVPLHTWHNRRMYTAEKIDSYNENPWGLGLGKYRYDEAGNWHALYAMVFMDSHNKIEPIAGYGYEKIWRPSENWRLGAGFTAGLTARQDYKYVPIPLILPLLSVEYRRFSLQTTYMPGSGKGNGNILFTWMRWQL
jgi:palmitoyl transferase